MKPGKVRFCIEYPVDLDDEEMVAAAKDAIVDDIIGLVFKGGQERLCSVTEEIEDPTVNPKDISDFLEEAGLPHG